jgi:hypothetical protein
MAAKTAPIVVGALAAGGRNYLSERAATRIESWPREHHRQDLFNQGRSL